MSSLKIQRDVQRGDLAAAVREVELVLRMVRDLRPRGVLITQLVADALSQYVVSSMISTILASPRLRAEHCERLIKAFVALEANSVDGYAEGLRGEYLVSRATLKELIHNQAEIAKAWQLAPGQSVVGAMIAQSNFSTPALKRKHRPPAQPIGMRSSLAPPRPRKPELPKSSIATTERFWIWKAYRSPVESNDCWH